MEPKLHGMEAEEPKRRATLSLRQSDAAMFKGFMPGAQVSIAVRGELTDLSFSDYGTNATIEVEFCGVKTPEPETFIEDMKALKVLKS